MNIRPKSRTERPRKTKIGTQVAHITRGSDITFKVKGQLAGAGAYCGDLPHSLFVVGLTFQIFLVNWKKLVFEIDNDMLSFMLHLIPFLLSSRVCNYL